MNQQIATRFDFELLPEFCSRNITQRCARVFVDKIPCYIVYHMKRYLKAARVLLLEFCLNMMMIMIMMMKYDDDVYDYEYDDDI